MDDMLKKVINTGVGLFALSNKRVQTALDKLVQESKLSEQEGQKIMAELRKNSDAKRKQVEKQVQDLAGSLRERVGLGSEEKEAAAAPKPKAAPKAAAKKPAGSPAGTAKKTAGKAGDIAAKAQRPAAAKVGVAKKVAPKKAEKDSEAED